MKITAIGTVQAQEFRTMLWVRVHTDDGPIGFGETFRNPQAIVAYIHETAAPLPSGQEPAPDRAPRPYAHALGR